MHDNKKIESYWFVMNFRLQLSGGKLRQIKKLGKKDHAPSWAPRPVRRIHIDVCLKLFVTNLQCLQ